MDRSVRETALEEARRILAPLAGRARVYLFGSFARGEERQHSDLDIGVLPKVPLPVGTLALLGEEFEESHIPYRVDLVDLSQAGEAFRVRVEKEGILWID